LYLVIFTTHWDVPPKDIVNIHCCKKLKSQADYKVQSKQILSLYTDYTQQHTVQHDTMGGRRRRKNIINTTE